MQEILYLKMDSNKKVTKPELLLSDLCDLECANKELEEQLKALPLRNLNLEHPGRYVKSILEIFREIHEVYPSLQIENIGENDFIITYEKRKPDHNWLEWIKAAAISFLSFFGAAFSIMTFHNDIDITRLFGEIYRLFTGQSSDGFTVLELAYSLGLGIGIVVFFNHLAGFKLTDDPTPLDVKMRTYECDVDQAIIAQEARQKE